MAVGAEPSSVVENMSESACLWQSNQQRHRVLMPKPGGGEAPAGWRGASYLALSPDEAHLCDYVSEDNSRQTDWKSAPPESEFTVIDAGRAVVGSRSTARDCSVFHVALPPMDGWACGRISPKNLVPLRT